MELRRILIIVRRRVVLLVVIVIAGLAAAYLGSSRSTKYQAQSSVLIGVTPSSANLNTLYGQALLAGTLSLLVPTPGIVSKAIHLSGVRRSVDEVVASTTSSVVPGSSIIDIKVTDHDPTVASTLANSLAEVFVSGTAQLIPLTTTAGSKATPSTTPPAKIAVRATVPTSPLANSFHRDVALGGLAGLLIGVVIILLVDFVGLAARTPRQLEARMGLPVIGIVPLQPDIEGAPPTEPGTRPEDVALLTGDHA